MAVSTSSDPTAGWAGFKIDSDATDSRWADFPTLGLDADGVYLAANMFDLDGGAALGTEVTMLSVPKTDLLLGTPSIANMTRFDNIGIGTDSPINR